MGRNGASCRGMLRPPVDDSRCPHICNIMLVVSRRSKLRLCWKTSLAQGTSSASWTALWMKPTAITPCHTTTTVPRASLASASHSPSRTPLLHADRLQRQAGHVRPYYFSVPIQRLPYVVFHFDTNLAPLNQAVAAPRAIYPACCDTTTAVCNT